MATNGNPDGMRHDLPVHMKAADHHMKAEPSGRKSTGEPVRHTNKIRDATWSRDGTRIVTASEEGSTRVDVGTRRPAGNPLRPEGAVHLSNRTPDGLGLGFLLPVVVTAKEDTQTE